MLDSINKKIFLLIIISNACSFSQSDLKDIQLTGNLSHDSYLISQKVSPPNIDLSMMPPSQKKSPFLGGLMSLVVPGAGEVYAGEYWKAAIFVAVEAAIITTAVVYDGKGNTQTEKFEKFANENWSVEKYASWTINNLQNPASVIYDPNFNPAEHPVFNNNGSVNWGELNRLESIVGRNNPNISYSHHLPRFGEQQYYELIGKYPQYSSGWNDFNNAWTDYHLLSSNFTYYAGERGKANDFYNVASKAVILLYINHFLSALDAAWSTVNYNKDLAIKMRVESVQLADHVELVPTLNLSFGF